jgi:hypothetical protein
MGQIVAINFVGPVYHPESCYGPHTIFSSYGSEAILPTEVEHKSFRVEHFNEEQSNNSQVDNLTRLEELREAVVIQSAKHQQAMRRYHAWNMSSHSFQLGDFILRNI